MLDNSIKFVQGVGEVRAKLLEKERGIVTMRDMLYHFPFRYIDRSRTYKVREVTEDNASAYIQLRVRVIGKSFAGEGHNSVSRSIVPMKRGV
jgi:ATP-dependent DNA helicase RecG